MSNPKSIYNEFIRANLPFGITYDEVRAQYVTFNGKRFPTYLQAKWYVDYIDKLGVGALDALYNSLFGNDEVGVWYDPSDLSTLFQDTAGTTPVTTAGQTVALMLDKSGNDLDATQPTAAARPTYQTDGTYHWLSFDGVDDFMVTPTITPGIDKVQVFAGVKRLSDAANGMLIELGAFSLNSFRLECPPSTLDGRYRFSSYGSLGSFATTPANYASPHTDVLATASSISDDYNVLRVNGATAATSSSDQGLGNYLAYPIYIGRRNGTSLPFNGNIYSLITRFGDNLETSTIETTETYVAGKTGVTL